MVFTPYKKIRNLVIFIICLIIASSLFDIKKSIDLIKSGVVWMPVLIIISWSLMNYKIFIGNERIVFYKIMGNNIEALGNEIRKIELESYKSGNWNWEKIYIYKQDKIYEYSISSFNQKKLLKSFIGFCELNGIDLDVSNYKKKRFEIV